MKKQACKRLSKIFSVSISAMKKIKQTEMGNGCCGNPVIEGMVRVGSLEEVAFELFPEG